MRPRPNSAEHSLNDVLTICKHREHEQYTWAAGRLQERRAWYSQSWSAPMDHSSTAFNQATNVERGRVIVTAVHSCCYLYTLVEVFSAGAVCRGSLVGDASALAVARETACKCAQQPS